MGFSWFDSHAREHINRREVIKKALGLTGLAATTGLMTSKVESSELSTLSPFSAVVYIAGRKEYNEETQIVQVYWHEHDTATPLADLRNIQLSARNRGFDLCAESTMYMNR